MNHALNHHHDCMVARAKTLDRRTRDTFIKVKPKVIKPKMEVAEIENDDDCNNNSQITLRMKFRHILTRAYEFLRKSHNLELNLNDDQTLGLPQMRPRSFSI